MTKWKSCVVGISLICAESALTGCASSPTYGYNTTQMKSVKTIAVVQESLTNVARHARATRVPVTLTRSERGFDLHVTAMATDSIRPRPPMVTRTDC